MNRKYLLGFVALVAWHPSMASEQRPAGVDPFDRAKLQRGAKIFMNYCSGCHSLGYLRYNRMALDLGITQFEGQIDSHLLRSNLIFTSAKIEEPIKVSMPPIEAREWFGVVPPDLSLVTRQRGVVWVYNYLKGFYADSSRPYGANNRLLPDTAMPNVFYPLLNQVEKNKIGKQDYDKNLEDLLSFLVYVGEPAQLQRYHLGYGVVLFLMVFCIMAYLIKKMYWKKILA